MGKKSKKTEVDSKLNKGLPELKKTLQKSIQYLQNNNVKKLKPNVAAEWHPTKNGVLTPDLIVAGSRKQYWGVCANWGQEPPSKHEPSYRTLDAPELLRLSQHALRGLHLPTTQ